MVDKPGTGAHGDPHRVVAVALPDVVAFDLSIAAQVFGHRDERERYAFTMCAEHPGAVMSTTGFTISAPDGLEVLSEADTVIIPGYYPLGDPSPAVLTAVCSAATGAKDRVPEIPFIPNKQVYILTCVDPRVDPAQVFGLELGDAIVARNVGGRATPAVIQDLAWISYLHETKTPDADWFELVVMHHTECGSGFFADDDLRHGFAARGFDDAESAETPPSGRQPREPWSFRSSDTVP